MNQQMNQMSGVDRSSFTAKQGQYLAFIDAYTRVNHRPPAEWEMQRFFGVTPPCRPNACLSCKRKSNQSKPLCRGTSHCVDDCWKQLATFRRKICVSERKGQACDNSKPRRRPAGDASAWRGGTDRYRGDCFSMTRPMLMRLSATTPSPTQRLIPVLPL
jgi:hypothetical protein